MEPSPPAGPPAARPSARRLVVRIGSVVAVGVFAFLVYLTLLGGRSGADPVGTVLAGEAWDRLTPETQDELARRARAVLDVEGMSIDGARQVLKERVRLGMRRLDDATLVRRLALQTAALGRADEATCAAFARASFAGSLPPDEVAGRLIAAQDDASLAEWMTIAIAALEAETRASPAPRRAPDAAAAALFEGLFARLSGEAASTIQAGAAPDASEAEACAGARALYAALDGLPAGDRALAALVDVAP